MEDLKAQLDAAIKSPKTPNTESDGGIHIAATTMGTNNTY